MIPVHMEPKGLSPDATALGDFHRAGYWRNDAHTGSAMLLSAIRKALGFDDRPVKRPVFKLRKTKRGRPRGKRKVRAIDLRAVHIQEIIANHFGETADSLRGPCKKRRFCDPRQIAMYAIRNRIGMSYPDIGFHFGRRDHTTVIYAVNEIEARLLRGDQKTVSALLAVRSELGA
jgi:hypothetical protein